jgi:hypothetical protein
MALVLPAMMTDLGSAQAQHGAVASSAISPTDVPILPQLNSGDGTLDVSFLDNLAVRAALSPAISGAGCACVGAQHRRRGGAFYLLYFADGLRCVADRTRWTPGSWTI